MYFNDFLFFPFPFLIIYLFFYRNTFNTNQKILLIVNFAWKKYEQISFIKSIYIPFFKKYFKFKCDVVYYGPTEYANENIKSNGLEEDGFYSYKSLIIAYEQNKGYYGYLYINDDGFLNPILFNLYNLSKIIIESIHYMNTTNNKWPFIKRRNKRNISFYESLNNVVNIICKKSKYISTKLCKTYTNPLIIGGWSDFFYIPHKNIKEVVCLMKLFLQNYIFLESTISTISQLFEYDVIWKKCTLNKLYYLYTCPYVHPVKYSIESNRNIISTIIDHYNNKQDWYASQLCNLCNVSINEFIISKQEKNIIPLKKNVKLLEIINY